MVENVEKIVITQSPTLDARTTAGKRDARQARRRKTSAPTSTSEISSSPIRSAIAPASQCASSGGGTISLRLAQVLHEAWRNREREHQADHDGEQRRLEQVVVRPASIVVEKDDPVRLGDCPHEPADDGQWAEKLDRQRPPRPPAGAVPHVLSRDAGRNVGAHPYLPSRRVLRCRG